jgi:hypothetical protein
MTKRYPALPEKFRGTVIKNLKPDVFVRAPNGRALVWDLTSKLDSVHLAKTMFYAELIGRELGASSASPSPTGARSSEEPDGWHRGRAPRPRDLREKVLVAGAPANVP